MKELAFHVKFLGNYASSRVQCMSIGTAVSFSITAFNCNICVPVENLAKRHGRYCMKRAEQTFKGHWEMVTLSWVEV